MPELTLNLTEVQRVRTGTEGRHLYLKARGEIPEHGNCDVYLFFDSRDEELKFEKMFNSDELTVIPESIEFVRGMGARIQGFRIVSKLQ